MWTVASEVAKTTKSISRVLRDNANLRTQLQRIIKRAGLTPWPKLFQDLRATRETELAEDFPAHVVCAWIGNSPRVAAKHYLQVTADHFDRALQNPPQHPTAPGRTGPQAGEAAAPNGPIGGPMRALATPCETCGEPEMGRAGFEPARPLPDRGF